MPIDKAAMQAYLAEIGLSEATQTLVLGELSADERKATQFVGQRLRHEDYTKKTQQTAQERQQIEQTANQQIQQYATQLSEAQDRINTVMKDFEKETISRSTAEARLERVKRTYNLSDEDIPAVTIPAAASPAVTPQIDVQAAMDKMKNDLLTTIRGDMMSLPRLAVLQTDIMNQHKSVTGKDISRAEFNELLDAAEKERRPLEQIWQEKYKIPELRTEQLISQRITEEKQKWEDQQRARATEEALGAVRGNQQTNQQFTQSPILQRKYEHHLDPATGASADKSQSTSSNSQPPMSGGTKLSGADRAAAKFIERRSNGIPLGIASVTK